MPNVPAKFDPLQSSWYPFRKTTGGLEVRGTGEPGAINCANAGPPKSNARQTATARSSRLDPSIRRTVSIGVITNTQEGVYAQGYWLGSRPGASGAVRRRTVWPGRFAAGSYRQMAVKFIEKRYAVESGFRSQHGDH